MSNVLLCVLFNRSSVQLVQRLDILCKSTADWNELFQAETLGIRQKYLLLLLLFILILSLSLCKVTLYTP